MRPNPLSQQPGYGGNTLDFSNRPSVPRPAINDDRRDAFFHNVSWAHLAHLYVAHVHGCGYVDGVGHQTLRREGATHHVSDYKVHNRNYAQPQNSKFTDIFVT